MEVERTMRKDGGCTKREFGTRYVARKDIRCTVRKDIRCTVRKRHTARKQRMV